MSKTINEKYVCRKEAAQTLGVSIQTVSNYIEQGLIKCKRLKGKIYIHRDSFNEFAATYTTAIAPLEDAVKSYTAKLEAELDNLDRQIKGTEAERRLSIIRNEVGRALIHINGILKQPLSCRELEMLVNYVEYGCPIREIADGFGLTAGRVRQIIEKSYRRLGEATGRIYEMQDELRRLRSRCFSQHAHIVELEKGNRTEYKRKMNRNLLPLDEGIMMRPFAEFSLSCRALNCLKSAQIHNLYELVQYKKTDLLKFRNFGKKSLTELDDLLDSLNLSFEMNLSNYRLV